MKRADTLPADAARAARNRDPLSRDWIKHVALWALCAAYLQGGYDKATDFARAVAEMQHFGLAPAAPVAVATIVLELGGSAMVITGFHRAAGALMLAVFTLASSLIANRFWETTGAADAMLKNSFFEHLGLVGGFLLVAWLDLRSPR